MNARSSYSVFVIVIGAVEIAVYDQNFAEIQACSKNPSAYPTPFEFHNKTELSTVTFIVCFLFPELVGLLVQLQKNK